MPMAGKQTILAIHGAGMHAGAWGGLIPFLTDYHFNALTLPGHDLARPSKPLASIEEMANLVREELRGMEKNSVILLGHSMGGLVALEVANDPAVAALVVMGTAMAMPVNDDLLKTATEKPSDANQMIAKWSISSAHAQAESFRALVASIQNEADPSCVSVDLKACDAYKNGLAAAQRVTVPVLVMSGEKDKMVSAASAQKLAEACKQGRFVQIDLCGHMPMIEQPLETAEHIQHFLRNEDVTR